MDAARCAIRLGGKVQLVYRRSSQELPARKEEVVHAKEEGVEFLFLTNPVEILENEDGWVSGVKCVRMELGEPGQDGRRHPKERKGSEFVLEADTVILALGTSPNPLIAQTTKELATNESGGILIKEMTGETKKKAVFAGGDAVSGAATVILAMEAGKKAAAGIDDFLS
jgi:glutamate synthase (NADPH/NADH) small chain